MLYDGESRISNYDDLLWVHGPRVGNWSWLSAGGGTSSKNKQESPLIHIHIYIYIIIISCRISLTLSHHFSLSFIASGRSSGLHPVSSQSYCMYVRAGRPAFARRNVGVHRSTSLMSSSLLLQQGHACLVRLTWIVFVIGGRWPYSWCFLGCCLQDLLNIACSIIV